MIVGHVTADREAIVSLRVLGPTGLELSVDALLDTGFTDAVTLSPDLVSALELPVVDFAELEVADGRTIRVNVHRADVIWEGGPKTVAVLAVDGGALIGMELLAGSRVTLEIVDGGVVAVERLP